MANEFGFFPDVAYGPDDFLSYFRDFYTNGIKAEDTSYFAVAAKGGLTLTVKKGTAYIDGHFYRPTVDFTVTLAESDTAFDRIDLIEIKCNYVTNKVYVDVIVGEPSGKPTIPHLQRDAAAYCLGLAAVTVKANTASVTQADIKDLRFDTNFCGVVVGKIDTISTTDLFAQYDAQWELLKAACAKDAAAVIKAWSALNALKTINGTEPTNGNIVLTQGLIPSGNDAYQMPYYIQSGTVTVTSSIRNGTSITFPKAFKSTPLLALTASFNLVSGGGSTPAPQVLGYGDLTATGFKLYPFGFSTSGEKYLANAMTGKARWFAMGKV